MNPSSRNLPTSPADAACLWIAQGLGSGRIRPGPGTWGSLVGVLLTLVLIAFPGPLPYLATTAVLIGLSVPICSRAEKLLGETDPGSIVLDEIVAMPVAFSGYAVHWWLAGSSPSLGQIRYWWPALIAGFVLFRIFDIWKPWPIRRLQSFHGGLGIVLHDIAAALASAVVLGLGTLALFYTRLATA